MGVPGPGSRWASDCPLHGVQNVPETCPVFLTAVSAAKGGCFLLVGLVRDGKTEVLCS